MTSETESGTGGVADVMAAYGGPFTFEYRRMPDAVRAAALANAVDLMAHAFTGSESVTEVIARTIRLAVAFEDYLAGEEAQQ